MNFLLVYIVKIQFTRNTIPNAITPYTIKPRNIFLICFKKNICTTSKWVPGILANQLRFHGFLSIKILQITNGTKKKKIDAYLMKKRLTLALSVTQILQLHNICYKGSIHLIKKHLITLHFLHCLINQELPIYLFLSHIFSITKQTQNAIFQNQPNKPTFSLSFLVFSETKQGV